MAEQFGRGVDFTESVKLIAHHVQQQCITGLDLLDEVDGVRLIELEHGDVRVQFAAERDSVSSAETTPRTKFEPVGLVNTFSPRSESIEATMRVVVVLPFVPDTNTTPSGNCPSVRVRKPGSIFLRLCRAKPNRHVW